MRSASRSIPAIHWLESRTLLADATTVGIYAQLNASETDPAGAGHGEFVVKRLTGPTDQSLILHYSLRTAASTATSGVDFVPLSGSVTFAPGKRKVVVKLIPKDDNLHEDTESVSLLLSSGNIPNVHSKATITIADNDAVSTTVSILAFDASASETDPSGAGKGRFLFSRPAGSTTNPLTIRYTTLGSSTAKNGVDLVKLSGSITIPAGKRSVFLDVVPIDDAVDETTERIGLSILDGDYVVVDRTASVTIADNDDGAIPQGWWNTSFHYRTPVSVDIGSVARTDQPVDYPINFTTVLSGLSKSGSLITDSIRVIETNSNGTAVVDENVPFQFDPAADFNASSNASGTLVFLLKGSTAANTTRKFHVYFDTAGSFSAPSFTSQVTTTDNDSDEGQTAIKIETLTATYWLQKANGGFSSIVDNDGHDWLGFSPTGGSEAGGEFRGTPNAVFPGGGFHAGFDVGSTTIISSGPLKTTIESTISVDKQIAGSPFTYKMRYEIYGNFVRATMVQADDSYWFLYEGTPGGSVDSNDSVVRSDGTVTDISTAWNDNDGLGNGADAAASNGEEWVYFRDSAVDRSMYFVHNTTDNIKDSYFRLDSNGSMTVFGFGRDNDVSDPNREKMTAQNNVFTFGLADGGGNFSNTSSLINGVYRDLSTIAGTAQAI